MITSVTHIGIDTAAVDGNSPPDYAATKAAGASFVYLKRCQHVYRDAFYERDAQRARDAGLVVGAYHFPGWGPRASAPKTQIAAFKGAGGTILRGVDLPPAIDMEGFQTLGTPALNTELVRQLVLEIEDQLQVTPTIYTSWFQFCDLKQPAMPWAARTPCWIKTAYRLPARQPVDQVAPAEPHLGTFAFDPKDYYRIPGPFRGWWIQQPQGDAVGFPGHDKTVDVDRFHTIEPGYRGPEVLWMRQKLANPAALPGTLATDPEVYDDVLADVVRARQTGAGLDADGIVGPRTFALLAWL